ncbi:hypothetical protein [Gracilimonas halophila]|uniref:Uncharacterized protein n=1 Tax=Gracilimonas halophila TaxID=1834464 RepID=A0ABW5JJZ8_9BACT
MTLTINKKDSIKKIREAIEKASSKRKKNKVDIDRYFGKVNFGMDGLEYQKKVRNEWE